MFTASTNHLDLIYTFEVKYSILFATLMALVVFLFLILILLRKRK